MKRIALIDHDIDNFHANKFTSLLAEHDLGFTVSGVWASRRDNLQAWAAARQVVAVDSVADLAPLADYVMVLAPSNPETHPDLCAKAFALGKTTYVDKTFATDGASAQALFALADRHGVAVQTSSVLRYTALQEHCRSRPEFPPVSIHAWASGDHFREYVIHPLEGVVSVMGPEIEAVEVNGIAGAKRIALRFSGGRQAWVHMHEKHQTPFFYVVSDAERTTPVPVDGGTLFLNGLRGILDFFRAGKALVPREETLAILRVLDTLA